MCVFENPNNITSDVVHGYIITPLAVFQLVHAAVM